MVDDQAPVPISDLPSKERQALRAVLHQLGSRVRPEQLETWFRTLDVRRIDDTEVELSVTSTFVRDWLQKNFLPTLQEAVSALGEPRRRVVLTHRDEDGWDCLRFAQPGMSDEIARLLRAHEMRIASQGPGASPAGASPGVTAPFAMPPATSAGTPVVPPAAASATPVNGAASTRRAGSVLNPNYTFDKFVVGPCNRLAHASALAIGENPGCAYNPLFVHGNVGLGKSHILQAICHTVLRRDPKARVAYLSCEDFTNTFIQAIQSEQLGAFREHYRGADVLVIDDVQFLANKEKTQDEFFHTFNALYDGQRQIVLSSDRPPIEIPTVEERLVSRFKWGLVVEVEAPCFDTRVAIVRRKASGRGVELADDVACYLAERVTSNIRELEGAVIKVLGFAALMNRKLDLPLAQSCLKDMPMRHAQVSIDEVMSLITTEFAITARELTGKSRTQTVSLPRQIAMYLLREHTESSLEDVGRIFGNRDHTTVLYAVNKIRDRMGKDRMFKEHIERLSNRLLTHSFR